MPNAKVLEIVSAIHKRVREQAASYGTPGIVEDWSNDLAKLHSAYNAAYCARNLVGTAPSLPKTFIGFVAGCVVNIAQRMLAWYTPQIRHFNEACISLFNQICSLEERKFRTFLSMAERVEKLEREMRLLKTEPSTVDAPARPNGTGAPSQAPFSAAYARPTIDTKHFYFELQGRFQSSVPADIGRLEMYRSVIGNLDPKPPAGTWLDIGCGRGRWLRLVSDGGHEGIGVDSNPAAIQQSRESGFEVTESDALEFLQSSGDRSFSVITAFHVLEHCPFEYTLNLVYQAARTLKPGGVLLIETPHAGNLLMAAEQFWMDPTHNRPIPLALMEFLFEYCGLRVVHQFEVNPRPESEHLPLLDLDPIHRLDRLLYGPQDYAMMGRRDA